MKIQGSLILALVFALIIAVFAVINVASVEVNFLFARAEVPLIIVILSSTLLGGLTVGLFGIIRQFRMQRKIRDLEQQLAAVPPQSAAVPAPAYPDAELPAAAERPDEPKL